MTKSSWRDSIHSFFHENRPHLERWYPGISENRLERFLFEMFTHGHRDQREFLDSFETHTTWKKEILKGTPLEYQQKESFFYKTPFYVDDRVLIPRSETELLVERAVELLKKNPSWKSMLEVGVGSGCIFLSTLIDAKRALQVHALDYSWAALEVAQINATRLDHLIPVGSKIDFILSDRLSAFKGTVDLIVSNPPYLRQGTDEVHVQVDSFEPGMALYLPEDSYFEWFKHFFEQVFKSLNPGGHFLMEGNPDTLEELKTMAINSGLVEVSIRNDYHQRKRFIEAKRG